MVRDFATHLRRPSRALTGITAAAAGVIVNLSIFFSIHTLFSNTRTHHSGPVHMTGPVWSTISPRAVFVTALAFAFVLRYKLSVLRVLGICAAVGASIYVATTSWQQPAGPRTSSPHTIRIVRACVA